MKIEPFGGTLQTQFVKERSMKKKLLALALVAAMTASLCACGNDKTAGDAGTTTPDAGTTEKETVVLTVWGGETETSQAFLQAAVDSFKEAYADQADFDIQIGAESEGTVKDTVLADVEAAADVYYLADDQIGDLVAAGALQKVEVDKDAVIAENGGEDSGAIQAASVDGTLYAYPATASNGYFMFYNTEYFTEEDVQSLDKMMSIAAENGKKVSMELTSGWYEYSFFQAAGLTLSLNEDGVTNTCDWNGEGGADVAQAMLDIASNPGFVSATSDEFVTGISEGTIIAGVSGTWNAIPAAEAWGDNYAAVKLPTYTLAGNQVQMASYAGYKLVGVNAFSEQPGWAMTLARWLTNYDNQVMRFEMCAEGPSNVEAAASDVVLADPATAALAAQSQYATVQRVGGNFWTPAETFGTIIVQGNPDKVELQTLLDNMVEGIVAPVE